MDYRNVLANVVAASVAALAAFMLRLAFPQTDPLLLAIVAAAVYAGLWTIVGDHTRAVLDRHLPPSARLERHWRLVSATVGLCAVAVAGLIVALVVSHHAFTPTASSTSGATASRTTIEQLNQKVIVTHETIILPVRNASSGQATVVTKTVPGTPPPVVTRIVSVTTPTTPPPATTATTPTQNTPSAATTSPSAPATTTGGG